MNVQVKVCFERENLNKTASYIRQHKLDDLDCEYRPFIEDYLIMEIRVLIKEEMKKLGKKNYKYFENLCHFPIQGIACTYFIGEEPNDSKGEFYIDISDNSTPKNIVACLYTYLI